MDMQKFIDKLYAATQQSGADAFQIEYNYAERKMLELFDGEIEKQEDTENQTLTLAVKKNGKIGSCTCGNLDEAVIPEIVKAATENALLIGEAEENFFYDGSGHYAEVKPYCPMADKLAAINPLDFMREIRQQVYDKAGGQQVQVEKTIFAKTKARRIMRNSLGLDLQEENESAGCSVMVTAQKGQSKEWGAKRVTFDKAEDFDAAYIASEALNDALGRLDAVKPESGAAKVVFKNKSFCDILAFLEDIVSARVVQKKKSQFTGKLGQVVAAPFVSVVDDPLLAGGYATSAFDGEGVPTKTKDIIADGVLQTYLHSLKTAHKDGVAPTGNGSGHNGNVTAMNLYLVPGDFSEKELLAAVSNGIYIDRLNGLHAGFNMVSGDFSFGAKGYLIEDGKVGKPLEQFTVAGNYYQLWKDIKMIADNLEFVTSGMGSPAVWVDGLTVGGK